MSVLILQVTELNGDLVVDSRLIAQRLDIDHASFMRTIKKYETKIEQRFGTIRFEIGSSEMPDGRINPKPEKYALLTEDQATTLMTFSKNTDAVVECKLDLVEAFSRAKQVIKTVIPAQQTHINELQLRLELAQAERDAAIAQKSLLDKRDALMGFYQDSPTHAALVFGATVITDKTPVERTITSDGRVFEGLGIQALAKKFGFGKNTQACWQWLESIGYGKDTDHWHKQLAAVEHHKLSPDAYDEILTKWNSGVRQRFIGEQGLF